MSNVQGFVGSEDQGVVSLWIGWTPSQTALEEYVAISYDDDIDDDAARAPFMKEFDIFWFDDDFFEAVYHDKEIRTVHDALEGHSCDDQIIPPFEKLVGREFREPINSIILVYETCFPGKLYSGPLRGEVTSDIKMHFVGTAQYVHR